MPASIVLAGLGPKLTGLRWESDLSLRIGRLGSADVVLHDPTVERLHAEVKNSGSRWIVRDLADSEHFPTLVNGVRLRGGQVELHAQDVLQVGQVHLQVAVAHIPAPSDQQIEMKKLPGSTSIVPVTAKSGVGPLPGSGLLGVRRLAAAAESATGSAVRRMTSSSGELEIQTVAKHSWEQALELAATDRRPLQGQAMLTLLRTNQHLCNHSQLDDLLQSILGDALPALGAQRGAILLLEPQTEQLMLKAQLAPGLATYQKGYSKTLAERCFRNGESLLCQDVNADAALHGARSVKQGAMSSVICALLRTPRQRLGILHLDRGPLQDPFTESDLYLADAVAASTAVGIECAQVIEQQREQFVQTVTTLARAVEVRDQNTGDHTKRVTSYALMLAESLQVPQCQRYQLQIGTPLHDIGKIGIDDAILRKPGKLTPAEFDAMKTHTVKGAAIIETIGSLSNVVPIVRHHHERWDGTGYPDRLGRDQIALTARIVAVADAFDAMTSHRPYRPAMSAQLAFVEIRSKAGTHFDPACVQALMCVRPQIEKLLKQG